MALTKHVWKDRDNGFILKFETIDIDGTIETVDMTVVTQMLVELENEQHVFITKDEVDPPVSWWDHQLGEGEASFKLGHWAARMNIAEQLHRVRITLFSLDSPNGIVWTSFARGELSIAVHDTVSVFTGPV